MILRMLGSLLMLFAASTAALAAPRELTVFSDGALLTIESTASKGVIEVPLPAPIQEGSLRIKPLDSGTIERVQVLPFKTPDRVQKELASLAEQKDRLNDRLQALSTREKIFSAAARSQSSKTPRKSKSNPNPMASVRQGTDFAIAQLEAVYTTRRRTEHELHRVTDRIDQLTRNATGGPTVKVFVTPAAGRARVVAVLPYCSWKAHYELRLADNATAHLVQLAKPEHTPSGFIVRLAPAALADGLPPHTFLQTPGKATRLAAWDLPVTQEQIVIAPLTSFSVTLRNSTSTALPGGTVDLYKLGEFLGTVNFPATAAQHSISISNRPE